MLRKKRIAHGADTTEAGATTTDKKHSESGKVSWNQAAAAQKQSHYHSFPIGKAERRAARVSGFRLRRVTWVFRRVKDSWPLNIQSFFSKLAHRKRPHQQAGAFPKMARISSPVYPNHSVSHADAIADCIEFIKRSASVGPS